jgi:hypothetical protein
LNLNASSSESVSIRVNLWRGLLPLTGKRLKFIGSEVEWVSQTWHGLPARELIKHGQDGRDTFLGPDPPLPASAGQAKSSRGSKIALR